LNQLSRFTNQPGYIEVPAMNNSAMNNSAMNNEFTIHSLLLTLKRRRRIIGWVVAICLLLGVTVSIFTKPRYRAFGEIEMQKSTTDGLGLENPANRADDSSDPVDGNINLQTQAQILESQSLALKVIKDLDLEKTEDFKPTFSPIGWVLGFFTPSGAPDSPHAALEDSPHRRDRVVKLFEKHLKVAAVPGTRLIDIQYTSYNPQTAAAVVNALAKSLVDYTLQSRHIATSQVADWLSGQLDDVKKQAAKLQGKVEQLQRDSGIYSLGISDAAGKEIAYSSTLDRLQQATQNLSTATSNRILKGALYRTVQNGDPELISGLAGSSLAANSPAANNSLVLLQSLRTQQATLATQVAGDISKYGTENPKLQDDKASLDSINSQIKAEVSRIGQRAANDYKAAQVVEGNMQDVYEHEHKNADRSNDKAIELLIARQEATDARTLYQMLFSRLKSAGVIDGLRSSNISVVDAGRVPAKPLPDVLMIMALSLFLGCFAGAACAIFADATNDRVEGMEMIENALQTNILAILPAIETGKGHRRLASGSSEREASRLALLNGPNTAYGEALRGLRTSLLLSGQGSKTPKVLLITSAAEREGKSTLSLNLAAVLALNGSRVLLIDGDMRRAGLSSYMGFSRRGELVEQAASGLSEALSSPIEPAVITPFPELPGLSALTAGATTAYPAELLGSERMASLVRDSAQRYDYVLIDSPPVLAVTDALILGRLADTTLLVAHHGRSTQRSLERAYRILHDVEGRNVGIVVNGVHRGSDTFSEFYGYTGTTYYTEGAL
jgi:capsular exopolysaccharide synthesis family protein